MFALCHEELVMGVLSLKKKKQENVFICGMEVICNNIVPSVFVYMSLAEHVKSCFTYLVLSAFQQFRYCCLLQRVRSGLQIGKICCVNYPIVFFMIVSNSQFFLLAINHSCMPLKGMFRLPLPCHDFCPFSNSATALLYR